MARSKPDVPIAQRVLLTVREAAAYTGLPVDYVYSLVRSGEWPDMRTCAGGTWRIPRKTVDAWVDQQSQVSA